MSGTHQPSSEVREALRDSLTERGIDQWWTAQNRLLEGRRPCDCWPVIPDRVLEAAAGFAEGYYV